MRESIKDIAGKTYSSRQISSPSFGTLVLALEDSTVYSICSSVVDLLGASLDVHEVLI